MPYLQLDVTRRYSTEDKRNLAAKMSETYSRMMSVDIRRISVAIRELSEGGSGALQNRARCHRLWLC